MCRPCVTAVFPTIRGSAHRPRSIAIQTCLNGNHSGSRKQESATGRPHTDGSGMAKLVFGMNQSLDGYVDHQAFAPSPALIRPFIEEARGQAGSVYGRRMYEVMRYWVARELGAMGLL